MMSKRKLKMTLGTIVSIIMIGSVGLFAQTTPVQFTAYSSSGIMDSNGSLPLLGNPTGGDLIHLILDGGDGLVNEPNTLTGAPGGDDTLLGTTYVGYGIPSSSDWDQGKFATDFTNSELFVPGNKVYIRAYNAAAIAQNVAFGASALYTIQNTGSESHDFGTFSVTDGTITPVEMQLFSVTGQSNRIQIEWSTATETNNAGFNIYRAVSEDGERNQVNDKIISGSINSQSQNSYQYEDKNFEYDVTYYYWLADVSLDGVVKYHGPRVVEVSSAPTAYSLDQNYPNPFNPSTTIKFGLKDDGHVLLNIYNIRGQLVDQLMNTRKPAGSYSLEWDGRDRNGNILPSGTYLYSIRVNDFTYTRKMAFMK